MQTTQQLPKGFENYTLVAAPPRRGTEEEGQYTMLDCDTGEKTIIDIKSDGKTPKRKKKVIEKEQPMQVATIKEEEPTESITITTASLSIEVEVSNVYASDTYVCVFTPSDSKYKVKPSRGTNFELTHNGTTYRLYSPGVYVDAEHIGQEVSFFLVRPEEEM